jgi:hypothetical protein
VGGCSFSKINIPRIAWFVKERFYMGYPKSNIEGLSPFGTLDYLWMKYTLYQVFTNSKFENNSDALEFMKLDDKEIGVFPFWKPSLFFVCSAWGRSKAKFFS